VFELAGARSRNAHLGNRTEFVGHDVRTNCVTVGVHASADRGARRRSPRKEQDS
jgi:hypothetical protein